MTIRGLCALMVLSISAGTSVAFAEEARVDVGIANTGEQTFHGTVNIGRATPAEIEAIVAATLQKDSLNAQEAVEYKQEVAMLSAEIGVRKPAVENFLRILGEAKVSIEELPAKLSEIAKRHLEMLERLSVLGNDDDPALRQRTEAARAAIENGDYHHADKLLAEAEEMDLAVARQAREFEDQAKSAADKRFLSAAAKRAKRGELSMIRLDYTGAAEHFEAAADIVPVGKKRVQSGYLTDACLSLLSAYDFNSSEAENLCKHALEIRKRALGSKHPLVAGALNNLGLVYERTNRYPEAVQLYEDSINILEIALGPDDLSIATPLNNLALIYGTQRQFHKASQLQRRALNIEKKELGPEHQDVATSLNNLALIYHHQGNSALAESLLKRSLDIREKALGREHILVANSLDNLAEVYRITNRLTDAEFHYERALAIKERAFGSNHITVANTLNNLAVFYYVKGDYEKAAASFERIFAIFDKVEEPNHQELAQYMENYSGILFKLGRDKEAGQWAAKAKAILNKRITPSN